MPVTSRGSIRRFVPVALVALTAAGCTRDQPPPPARSPALSPAVATATPPKAPDLAAGEGAISGTIIETMDAGGYTYAKIDRGTGAVWVAGPATKLAVGGKLGAMSGTLMTGFRSDTLQRTFDQIWFVGAFPGAAPAGESHAGRAATGLTEAIEPAAGGQTVAAVFAGKESLVGKPVVVRGKVVKLNTGIMGRNWIHLRDGTGGTGTNDLLVTTTDTATLGDVVLARGTLATNRDFGGGYKYDVLIENATLAVK